MGEEDYAGVTGEGRRERVAATGHCVGEGPYGGGGRGKREGKAEASV